MSINYRYLLLLLVSCAAITAAFLMQPLPQPVEYHNFVDTRKLHELSNFWNVVSNAGFFVFGVLGFISIIQNRHSQHTIGLQRAYALFFTAAILLAFGSAFYHLQPSNQSLVWDRLPMSIAFMALFTIVFAEHLMPKRGGLLLLPLLLIGVWSVIYWYKTEQLQVGDLRPYLLVQFLPLILILLMLVLFKTPGHNRVFLWMILLLYTASKFAEHFDQALFDMTGLLSGHSIKHILASLSILFFHFHLLAKPVLINEDD